MMWKRRGLLSLSNPLWFRNKMFCCWNLCRAAAKHSCLGGAGAARFWGDWVQSQGSAPDAAFGRCIRAALCDRWDLCCLPHCLSVVTVSQENNSKWLQYSKAGFYVDGTESFLPSVICDTALFVCIGHVQTWEGALASREGKKPNVSMSEDFLTYCCWMVMAFGNAALNEWWRDECN